MRIDSNTKSQNKFETRVLPVREDQQTSGRLKSPTITRCSSESVRCFNITCSVYITMEFGGIYTVHRKNGSLRKILIATRSKLGGEEIKVLGIRSFTAIRTPPPHDALSLCNHFFIED